MLGHLIITNSNKLKALIWNFSLRPCLQSTVIYIHVIIFNETAQNMTSITGLSGFRNRKQIGIIEKANLTAITALTIIPLAIWIHQWRHCIRSVGILIKVWVNVNKWVKVVFLLPLSITLEKNQLKGGLGGNFPSLTTKDPTWAASTNLSKSILTAKIPRASGKAFNKCPALGYSTPGAGSARSAQVTLCGSQNLSFQNQAERAAMFQSVPFPGRWVSSVVSYPKEKMCGDLLNTSPAPGSLEKMSCHTQLYRNVKRAGVGAAHPARVFKIRVVTVDVLFVTVIFMRRRGEMASVCLGSINPPVFLFSYDTFLIHTACVFTVFWPEHEDVFLNLSLVKKYSLLITCKQQN